MLLGDNSKSSGAVEKVQNERNGQNERNKQISRTNSLDGLFKSQNFNENYARLVDAIVWDSEIENNNAPSTEIVCQNKGELSIDEDSDNIVCVCENGYK